MKLLHRLAKSRSVDSDDADGDIIAMSKRHVKDRVGFRQRAKAMLFKPKTTTTKTSVVTIEQRRAVIVLGSQAQVQYQREETKIQVVESTVRIDDEVEDDQSVDSVDAHILPEIFIESFRRNGSECICAAYLMDHPLYQSSIDNSWFTTLPEDVFILIETQAAILNEYMEESSLLGTKRGDVLLAEASLSLIQNLLYKQQHFFELVLQKQSDTLIQYMAAANDLFLMNDKADELIERLAMGYAHVDWAKSRRYIDVEDEDIDDRRYALLAQVRRTSAELTSQLSRDAVTATHRASSCIMKSINRSDFIMSQLFSRRWEDEYLHSEVAVAIIRVIEHHRIDLEDGLADPFLYNKVITEVVRSTVCFYLRCLVEKADRVRTQRRNRKPIRDKIKKRDNKSERFASPGRAVKQVAHDLEALGEYFLSVAKDADQSAALLRSVKKELFVLMTVLEFLWAAVDGGESLEQFILFLHKRTGADSGITKQFLSDIWLLFAPSRDQKKIRDTVNLMQAEMQLLSLGMREESRRHLYRKSEHCDQDDPLSCLQLEQMLRVMYEDRNTSPRPSTFCGNLLEDVEHLTHKLPPILTHDETRKKAIGELTAKLRNGLDLRRPFQKRDKNHDDTSDEKKE